MQNYETNPRPAQVATTTRAINIRPILAPVQATGGMRSSDVMDNIGEKSRAGDVNASPRRPGYKRRGFNPVYGISEPGLEELSFMFQSESQQRSGPINSSFWQMLARCDSTVRGWIFNSAAISLVALPAAIMSRIRRSARRTGSG